VRQPTPIRVAIVTASDIEGAGLAALLAAGTGFEVQEPVVGRGADPVRVLAGEPDVVVIGSAVGGYEWLLTLVGALSAAGTGVGMVAVVDRPRSGWLSRLAASGISGLAELATPAQQLRTAVMAVAGGHDWVAGTISSVMAEQIVATAEGRGLEPLTTRELAVLRVLAQGADNVQAGAILGISQHTVASHVQSIATKLRASSRLHAVAIGIRTGLIDP
jgi:DNA-binding NarL/FixJ family response regulator